jgi:propionyl-CoA carboxylase alpha chain
MIRVAAGERLPRALTDKPVAINGWAFESRVYAEDPFRNFLPSTGRLRRYVEPQAYAAQDAYLAGPIRADSGVRQGSEISMFYDPMICKLVTHGPTRGAALDLMRAALDAYVVTGVGHNIPFLRDLTENARFVSGDISTQFIREEYPDGFKGVALSAADRCELAAGAAVMHALREETFCETAAEVVVTLGETEGAARGPAFAVALTAAPSAAAGARAGARDWTALVTPEGAAAPTRVHLGGVQWSAQDPLFFAARAAPTGGAGAGAARPSDAMLRIQNTARLPTGFALVFKGANVNAAVRSARAHALGAHMRAKAKKDMSRALQSPMPGKLVSVAVKAGDAVELGQELAVVEAMKMANVLRSPRKGVVKMIAAKAGDTLAVDQVILEFDA